MAGSRSNGKIQKDSGIYNCRVCGKQTRETGEGESECGGGWCLDCYLRKQNIEEHEDGIHAQMGPKLATGSGKGIYAGCHLCEAEVA